MLCIATTPLNSSSLPRSHRRPKHILINYSLPPSLPLFPSKPIKLLQHPSNCNKMEIDQPNPLAVAKKLWNMVRVLFLMMRKGIAKSKIMVELHLMLKRGKLAGKAIVNSLNLILHHHHQYYCRSHNNTRFISPREYEFSCSNSPAPNPFHAIIKRKHSHHHSSKSSRQYDDVSTLSAVQKVLTEMLNNNNNNDSNNSPLVTLPGFGKSPMVRQLRVTDSPFPLKDDAEGDNTQVDIAAEEFINKFYKDLNSQNRSMAASFQSPLPYHNLWDR